MKKAKTDSPARLPGIGEIKATALRLHSATKVRGVTPVDVAMAVVVYGRKRISRQVHDVPTDRAHLVRKGARLPVKVGRKDPTDVVIDWVALDEIDDQIASRARVLTTGASGIGQVEAFFDHTLGRRTPGGDYLWQRQRDTTH